MRWLRPLSAAVWLAFLLVPLAGYGDVTVILTRHAEKAVSSDKNPPLSAAGQKRADLLSSMLADSGVDAIFVSEYLRTQQTAQPLADRDHLKLQIVSAADSNALVKAIHARSGGVVLVVGHSNTVPEIIAALGGPAVKIADGEYDNLFILTVGASQTSFVRLRYGDATRTADKDHVMKMNFRLGGGPAGQAAKAERVSIAEGERVWRGAFGVTDGLMRVAIIPSIPTAGGVLQAGPSSARALRTGSLMIMAA